MIKEIIFKNIHFKNFCEKDFKKIIKSNGLLVFPAGPGLTDINKNIKYYRALQEADFVFFDSGYFVLLLRYFKKISVSKFSGYKFLKLFFNYLKKKQKKKIFLIVPSCLDKNINYNYFRKNFNLKTYSYVAPQYKKNNFNDFNLIKILNKINPNYIIINLGGGTQEVLGLHIKKRLKNRCTIICTGGAISFFNGVEAPINNLFDNLYIGWMIRILYNPRRFFKRYLSSFKLLKIVLKSKIKIIYR
jgi:exopolysaccharide biosynthesis WecB/TagA/CpsF family protein